jgi:ABC-type branched-subunit amino acid transport system ATPase component
LVQFIDPVRLRVVSAIARRHGIDPVPLFAGEEGAAAAQATAPVRPAVTTPPVPDQRRGPAVGTTLLEARHLRKRFGGVTAVDDVSFVVRAGETLGLIGPNGAGKTTTFELLGGFTRADTGQVIYDRRDISHLSPEQRAGLGMIRSFQDAALFPTMTVKETVMLALERTQPTRFLTAAVGATWGERRREERARELVAALGLDRYRDKQVQELSTGTRRITEIACLVALEPTCLLLDEPSSGIAQRETEALGTLLVDLKAQLNLTLVVIEHDIPLIMGISDRIVAMADGKVIAAGTPAVVRSDQAVIDAYLGGSVDAIERSGVKPTPAAGTSNGSASVDAALDAVRGLGEVRRKQLLDTFGTPAALREATVDDLRQISGVGPSLAKRIREALQQETRV